MDDKQLLWNRYSMHVEAYHKYFDIVVKLNLFYYGITGAILSFYFTKSNGSHYVEYSLLLPIFFSVGLVLLFAFAIKALRVSKTDMRGIVQQLEMRYYITIDALIYMLWGSIVFVSVVAICITYVFITKCL